MLITSLENNKIKKYLKLKEKKYRELDKLFIVEGEHLVEEAIKSNLLVDLLVLSGYDCKIDFPYTFISLNIMKKFTNMDSVPRVLGIVKFKESLNIIGNKVLILDNIQDPGNLGTIIRSSVAFNVTDIVLSLDTVDLYNDKVIRASQGMIFKINIIKKDLIDVIKSLKSNNYVIMGTDVKSGVDASTLAPLKYALIMGNEGNGIREEIKEMCDEFIYIDMNSECESLNVGVATSIILYELNR